MLAPLSPRVNAQVIGKAMETKTLNVPNGLQFRLSEGVEGAESRTKPPAAETDPLSEGETQGLLNRLPQIKTQDSDKTDFAKRVGSLPPPKTGEKIPVKFPSDEMRGTPKVDVGSKLEVIRFSPEGEVKLAPDLNITFSQPMVAVTSQEQAAKTVPVELSPAVEGRWRWLGTKTLMFDTTKRFPMATRFTARVPAGTRAANGQVLEKDFTWSFTTPPPTVERMVPANQTVRRDALMFIRFDQEIDREAVIKTISVTAQGKKIPIRLATDEEIAKDSNISYSVKESQPNRWIAFRAVNSDGLTENALPAASPITVTVEKGTPSAEGPLTTTAPQQFSFQTFSPLQFVGGWCGWQQKKDCSPFDQWLLEFNNALDAQSFAKEIVKVEPPVENMNIYPGGRFIYFQGYKKGRTTYKITVGGGLKDIFGQSLGKDATVTIKVGEAPASLYAQGGNMVVLDPTAKPSFSIYSTNQPSVKLKIYKVEPADWAQFQEYVRRINYDDDKNRPAVPGKLVVNKTVAIENKPDEMVETRIDLAEVLTGGFGNVIVDIEPTVRRDKYDRTRIFSWVQATRIGLDAFVDNEELVGFATDLQTGKPLAGVELSIYPNGGKVTAQNAPPAREQSWWEWLMSWGTSDESASEIHSTDENGETVETDTVEAAETNVTTETGILRLPLPEQAAKQQNVLIARKGGDVAFLPENSDYFWQQAGSWYKKPVTDSLRWFVFDDRKMYRPKEEVAVKGYIRVYEGGKLGDINALGDKASGLNYSVKDSRNNEIAKGTANLNAFGAFDFKFSLPDNANLGYARIDLTTNSGLPGRAYNHNFQIQEFRRPEFEVKAQNETEAPYLVGTSANVSVTASYYAGGGLANADVNWTVRAQPTNYTPPNRGDFIFGKWIPWWYFGDRNDYGNSTVQTFKGITDASGKHVLKIDFDSAKPSRPYAVTASGAVQDVNRQTWSASTNLLVHPSELYIGVRSPRTFVQKGEKIFIESIVTDIEGRLIAGRDAEIKAVLKDWVFEKGLWVEKTIDEQVCGFKSAAEVSRCEFVAKQGGRYLITAVVMDDRERFNETELTVWVPGGKTPPNRSIEQEKVELIPSKKDFAPGETAEILVISPFPDAEGVLTLRRDGIVKTERFSIKENSVTLKIPLEEKYLPNIYAQVDLVGAAVRTNDKGEMDEKLARRPAYASGQINLPISFASRALTVEAVPADKTLEPGGATKVSVEVKDNNGAPVSNSEVAVVVVDESVLALSGYDIANPLGVFYSQRGSGVLDYHLRKDVLLGNPDDVAPPPPPPPAPAGVVDSFGRGEVPAKPMLAAKRKRADEADMAAEMTADRDDAQSEGQINMRENFDALAVFAPNVKTDSNGRATIDVKLPDNLTRYRVTAVVVDAGKRFGKGESDITARQPLMVRPSAPRFMNFGDKIELPVVVQNQTDSDMTVNVAVRAANALLTGPAGKRVVVKANDRSEVRFPVAADKAGTARFQIAVNSGKFSDAAEIQLPVWTPATTEAFATYGTTDKNGAIIQPVQTPGDVYPQFGGLEVTTSSTQMQELTDAFIYLYRYPFEGTEQVSSRMISIAALQDVLKAFKAEGMPTEAQLKASFAKDIKILESRQNSNGYFGLWRRDGERYKFNFITAHTAHALVLAKAKGYPVPQQMLDRVKPYLQNIESHYNEWERLAPTRWTISAYALYVRDLMGDKDAGKAKKLLAEATLEKMPFEALGWILSVLADDPGSKAEVEAITRFLMNRTTETAATANFVTDYGDGAWVIMYSNRRADGVLLEALLKSDQDNDLIPKLVRGLLDHRKKGAWANTQENVFILLALDKYFQAYEKVTPDFVTRIWLGSVYAGEQAFKGRSVDSNFLEIPMSYLTEQGGTSNLILDRQGAGRLYYRIGMKYAPKNLRLEPADYGFTVLRSYEAVDNAEDVKQAADGSWTIKAGARVRVRLTMVAQARRYHVALVDPLPAGLEILNPELAVTEEIPADATPNTSVVEYGSRSWGGGWWWRRNWFEHQNFRDERAEAFSSLLWEGVYNYSYVTRATTPGEFVVPPAKAEEMYHPETFGRSGTDFVRIE